MAIQNSRIQDEITKWTKPWAIKHKQSIQTIWTITQQKKIHNSIYMSYEQIQGKKIMQISSKKLNSSNVGGDNLNKERKTNTYPLQTLGEGKFIMNSNILLIHTAVKL